ncbi:ATP synthase subunit I [Jiella avicenniae]|uniref:ATP synthase subunit I n=1 Tax=Jiella avicenniae TaxID=2907202 RepID=A0A9X1T4Q6_9HYPH|nr:ATP synthase subunit I [Jiella avicenniae]MCE7027739.1 ATP synthase subunit I [Jiella avicenniae]MCE7028781.1 ATP synthase subunit I [Jiella avicenniae]
MAFDVALPEWTVVAGLPLCLLAGVALGLAHFGALWRQAQALAGKVRPSRAAAEVLARFAVLVAGFVAASLLGAGPLLALALGVMIGRWLVMRRVERADP